MTFSCDMTAIPAAERDRHKAVMQKFFGSVTAVEEIADGYSFAFPDSDEMLQSAAEFMGRERLCCPFFRYVIHIEPASGQIQLRLSGPEGVKPFILAEVGGVLPPGIKPK